MTVYRRPDPIPRPRQALPVETALAPVRARVDDLTDLVGGEIIAAIVAGRFAENSILPNEIALAQQLRVSRTALREAVKGLAAKGLVEPRRRRGTLVLDRRHWNVLDADVIAALRRAGDPSLSDELWTAASRALPDMAAAAAQAREGAVLMRHAEEVPASAGNPEELPLRAAFVEALARAGGNRFLETLLRLATASLVRDDPAYLQTALMELTRSAAIGIANAVADGDAGLAMRLMRDVTVGSRTQPDDDLRTKSSVQRSSAVVASAQ